MQRGPRWPEVNNSRSRDLHLLRVYRLEFADQKPGSLGMGQLQQQESASATRTRDRSRPASAALALAAARAWLATANAFPAPASATPAARRPPPAGTRDRTLTRWTDCVSKPDLLYVNTLRKIIARFIRYTLF